MWDTIGTTRPVFNVQLHSYMSFTVKTHGNPWGDLEGSLRPKRRQMKSSQAFRTVRVQVCEVRSEGARGAGTCSSSRVMIGNYSTSCAFLLSIMGHYVNLNIPSILQTILPCPLDFGLPTIS